MSVRHAQKSWKGLFLNPSRFLVACSINQTCHTHMCHQMCHKYLCLTILTCITPHTCNTYMSQVVKLEPIDMAGANMDFNWNSVGRDSFICVTWLLHICDMTHLCVWYDSFIGGQMDLSWNQVKHDLFTCEIWLIHACDLTHSYLWHAAFICVVWIIHMSHMTRQSCYSAFHRTHLYE